MKKIIEIDFETNQCRILSGKTSKMGCDDIITKIYQTDRQAYGEWIGETLFKIYEKPEFRPLDRMLGQRFQNTTDLRDAKNIVEKILKTEGITTNIDDLFCEAGFDFMNYYKELF